MVNYTNNLYKAIILAAAMTLSTPTVVSANGAGVTQDVKDFMEESCYIESLQESDFTTMYTNDRVNIRRFASTDSEIIATLNWNTEVKVLPDSDGWYKVWYEDEVYYIASDYVSESQCDYNLTYIPNYSGFKSYMGYNCISSKSSPQYKLQHTFAYTGNYGIRMVDDRYCVALGTGTGATVGDYGELELANGYIIPIIVGDIKANQHTDASNLISVAANCASEFIIDNGSLDRTAKNRGDLSAVDPLWESKVVVIRIYEYNVIERI